MKRILFIMCMMLSIVTVSANATIYQYKAYELASASVVNGDYTWGDWHDSKARITINTVKRTVYIKSTATQYYTIVESSDPESDGEGGEEMHLKCYDREGDPCIISIRLESCGNSQLYVRYPNIAWVYNMNYIK